MALIPPQILAMMKFAIPVLFLIILAVIVYGTYIMLMHFIYTKPFLPYVKAKKSKGKLKFALVSDGLGELHPTLGTPTSTGIITKQVNNRDFREFDTNADDVMLLAGVPTTLHHAALSKSLNIEASSFISSEVGKNETLEEKLEELSNQVIYYKCHNTVKMNGHIKECNETWPIPEKDFKDKFVESIWRREALPPPCPECGTQNFVEIVSKQHFYDYEMKNPVTINLNKVVNAFNVIKSGASNFLRLQESFKAGEKSGEKKSSPINEKFILSIGLAAFLIVIAFMALQRQLACTDASTVSSLKSSATNLIV